MSYQMASFQRLGRRERREQEPNDCGVANPLSTRQIRKYTRIVREGCQILAFKEMAGWANQQLKGRDIPAEFVALASSIGPRATRIIETNHAKRSYQKDIGSIVEDTKRLLDKSNGSGDEFVQRWTAMACQIEEEMRQEWRNNLMEDLPVPLAALEKTGWSWKVAIYWGIWGVALIPLLILCFEVAILVGAVASGIWGAIRD